MKPFNIFTKKYLFFPHERTTSWVFFINQYKGNWIIVIEIRELNIIFLILPALITKHTFVFYYRVMVEKFLQNAVIFLGFNGQFLTVLAPYFKNWTKISDRYTLSVQIIDTVNNRDGFIFFAFFFFFFFFFLGGGGVKN